VAVKDTRVAFFYQRARLALRQARGAHEFSSLREMWLANARKWRDLARQTRTLA
jgi:hypothetical protein